MATFMKCVSIPTADEVKPRAATPLNDAIGYCIDPILDAPQTGRKILEIFTDGLENSSQKYRDVAKLRMRLEEFQSRGNIVIFLAANLDAQKAGAEYGIPPELVGRPPPGYGLVIEPVSAGAAQARYLERFHTLAEAAGFSPTQAAFDTE